MPNKSLKKLTPVLFVEKIEPCLPFWVERLGFQKTAEVPEGEALGFVILVRDSVAVMLQTRASVAKDIPALAQEPSRSFLYVEVADFADIKRRLEGADIVIPEPACGRQAQDLLRRHRNRRARPRRQRHHLLSFRRETLSRPK